MYLIDPKSEAGSRLLHKSTFHTAHFPATLHLLRSNISMPESSEFTDPNQQSFAMDTSPDGPPQPLHQVLHTTQSGTLALLTPLSEDSYRRLSNLSAYLAGALDSACGLNARAFRASETGDGGWDAGTGARGVLDGNLLMRWGELGERGRREGLGKYGEGEWMFWGEREVLAGWGIFGGRGK
jgi:cleavage and polyadenylation specificity factor subunit 1